MRVEPGAKRVRVYVGGEAVADTIRPLLVWEVPYYPAYYLPVDDVRMELLAPTGNTRRSPSRGEGTYFAVKGGDRVAHDAALRYADSPVKQLRDHVRFDWDAVDAVFEEDEEVFIHPRSPDTRVDILHSSRHVQVIVDGVTVADTHRPTILYETGLPPRYYVPRTDVRMDLLDATDSRTGCPYKGFARYWNVRAGDAVHEDLAWSYPTPLPESQKIAGLVAFYNERVDLVVDGERQERPRTPFS
ncbi:MAG TPA: DUF427 domain-containing protein [Acidimicrobiia bacterium]